MPPNPFLIDGLHDSVSPTSLLLSSYSETVAAHRANCKSFLTLVAYYPCLNLWIRVPLLI